MKIVPELLAPAGSFESLKSAINAGADSVYLSGKRFGARQYADNFTMPQISEAIEYAHLRKVKVYLTVNTLIKDSEVLDLGEYLLDLYQMGVDAILIQDLGLLNLVRELVPEMNLHASTQMTIHNEDGLLWAQENGFKRVVLPRELSLEDLRYLRDQSDIELEIFLHGALCYAYSGQCLLSSLIGGRSGNRGRCAQPCRKAYHLLQGEKDRYGRLQNLKKISFKDLYLLSTRDLCLYQNLDQLVETGINSLKIEGRMRSADYVFQVVKIYRQALDQISAGTWKADPLDMEKLRLVFNRNYTLGKLFKKRGPEFMGIEKPGHRGLLVGRVKNYFPSSGVIKVDPITKLKPQKGDGIYFIDKRNNARWGMDLEENPQIKGKNLFLKVKKPLKKGSKVYLTKKKDIIDYSRSGSVFKEDELYQIYLYFEVDEKNFPVLKGELNTGKNSITSQAQGKYPLEPAISKSLSRDQIKTQLTKSADKPFKIKIKHMKYPGGLFLPLSRLNQLRRELLNDLEKKLLLSHQPPPKKIKTAKGFLKKKIKSRAKFSEYDKNRAVFHPSQDEINMTNKVKLSAYVDEWVSLEAALASEIEQVYFEVPIFYFKEYPTIKNGIYDADHIVEILNKAENLAQTTNSDLIWKWPTITRPSLLRSLKELCQKINPCLGIMTSNVGTAWYLHCNYPEKALYGSSALNIWNSLAIKELSTIFTSLTLSSELSKTDIDDLFTSLKDTDPPEIEIIVQGNIESLISRECLIPCHLLNKKSHMDKQYAGGLWTLKDGKNRLFPVKISSEYGTIILNSVETCLVDYLPYLIKLGVNNFSIDARGRGASYLEEMAYLYKEAISIAEAGFDSKLAKIKSRIKTISQGGLTSGNYLRGV